MGLSMQANACFVRETPGRLTPFLTGLSVGDTLPGVLRARRGALLHFCFRLQVAAVIATGLTSKARTIPLHAPLDLEIKACDCAQINVAAVSACKLTNSVKRLENGPSKVKKENEAAARTCRRSTRDASYVPGRAR